MAVATRTRRTCPAAHGADTDAAGPITRDSWTVGRVLRPAWVPNETKQQGKKLFWRRCQDGVAGVQPDTGNGAVQGACSCSAASRSERGIM